MRHDISVSLGMAAIMVMLTATRAPAQTTAVGPYLATPAWDQKLQCDTTATCPRFIVLSNWNSEAVLDRETGLVWERSPSPDITTRPFASSECVGRSVGNRMGWRLPTIQELTSLIDRSAPAGMLKLPPGHPFLGTAFAADAFWSATAANAGLQSWIVGYVSGGTAIANNVNFAFPTWCVRGGQGLDLQ